MATAAESTAHGTGPVSWSRRYAVDEAFTLPPLIERLALDPNQPYPVRQSSSEPVESQTTHFDTPEGALRRAGLSLTRRTDPDQSGWHLVRTGSNGDVLRLRAGLGRSETLVPLALRRAAWTHTRDAALEPVSQVTRARVEHLITDNEGDPLVVVVDELSDGQRFVHVHAAAAAADLEQAKGVAKAVARELRQAGAAESADPLAHDDQPLTTAKSRKAKGAKAIRLNSSSTAGDLVVAYLTREVRRLTDHDLGVRLDHSEDLHQMRIAARRIRTALEVFGGFFRGDEAARLAAEAGQLGSALGAARDLHVVSERLAKVAGSPGIATVQRELQRRHRAGHAEVVATLNSPGYRALVLDLEAFTADPPLTGRAGKPARGSLVAAVAAAHSRTRTLMAKALSAPEGVERDDLLHAARKAGKRGRYAAEVVQPAAGRAAERFAHALERLQESLGDHHDSVVVARELETLALESNPAVAFQLGRLHAAEQERQRAAAARAEARWAAVSRKAVRGWLG